MKVSRVKPDRSHQKARTRAALVEAAAELLRQHVTPTVVDAARAARISRATAYRYFPTQESLLLEISSITPTFESVDTAVGNIGERDPAERLGVLVDLMTRTVFSHEAQMRTALRLYLDQWIEARRVGASGPPLLRVGRRMIYMDTVLAGLRAQLSPARWRSLRAALALTMGPEALIVMKDVCQLPDAEAAEVLRWAALTLLRAGAARG